MQTIVQVMCTAGRSLRDLIGADDKIEQYGLKVTSQQTAGRSPGWSKLHSVRDVPLPGAINLEWNPRTETLSCRIVTRGGGKRPSPIVGDLINYLLRHYTSRILTVTINPRRG